MGGGEGNKKFEKSYFDVLGLCCSSEVSLIEKILKPLDGIHDVSVIVPSRTVIVIHDAVLISQIQIAKALNQARLEANVRVRGEKNYRKKWPSPFAVVCGVLLLLSFLRYLYHPLKWLAVGSVAVGILPIILKAIASLRNWRLDINTLMLIAVAGSIFLKDYWEAGTIVFLYTISDWLESRASHKATAVMSSLMNIAPQRAVLAETGEEVDAGDVKVNTKLAVKAGDIIPIDGVVVEGKCEVDEKTLTGESFPVAKQIESTVWAGTINLNGYISVRTTALADDCVVARMAKLVEEAQNNKSRTQRFIDKCAKYYTPAVLFVSLCLAVIPAALRVHNQSEWFHLALVVLVSGCPCALILSTPVAMFCALSKAGTSGLLVKGPEYFETLAKVRIMAFDKTGTITRGEFQVTNFQSLMDDVGLDTLLCWVSSIESKSSHPMAAALIDYAESHSIEPKPDNVEEFQNFPGEGIYGKIDEKDIYVGNRKIAIRAGCATVPTSEGDTNEGKSIGYIFLGSSLAGIFSLSDVCRTGVREALNELKSMGIKTAMLTGDCQAAAKHAQDQLGGALEAVHAELLPQDKARIIKEFQKESPTAMVGDGLNDAPALATADIGISMGISGSALATETGNIILMSNDIRKIPKAVQLARQTRRKIIENMILSVTTKAAIIALAIAGHPLVWAAVLADVGTCLLVIFNSMLLLRGTPISSHGHKHGCKPTQCHSSHSHRQCSSVTKVQDKCEPQKCSSKMCASSRCGSGPSSAASHGNNKCSDSENKHGCCAHADQVQETNHLNHESRQHCSSVNKVQEKCKPQKCSSKMCTPPGCQSGPVSAALHGNSKCSDLENKHGCCAHADEAQEIKHLEYRSIRDTISEDSGTQGSAVHSNSSPCAEDKSANLVGRHDDCVHSHPDHETLHCHGLHEAENCEQGSDSSVDLDMGSHNIHNWSCSTSLKRRHCCKSFRRECCGSSPHFGVGFTGGLSEIVIE